MTTLASGYSSADQSVFGRRQRMVEQQGGQWNVATKENEVYLERVTDDGELLFDESLDPAEARQLARLLTKHADGISESDNGKAAKDNDSDDSKDSRDSNGAEESDEAEVSDKSDETKDYETKDSDNSDKS
jgi:hypothetical protein